MPSKPALGAVAGAGKALPVCLSASHRPAGRPREDGQKGFRKPVRMIRSQ